MWMKCGLRVTQSWVPIRCHLLAVQSVYIIAVFLFSQCSRQMIPGLMKKPKLPEAFKQRDCDARNWLQRRWQSWKPNGARGGSPEASRKIAVG